MSTKETALSYADTQKIRAGLEQAIITLDENREKLGENERHLREQLVKLHSEIEKLALDSRHPFPDSQ
jgi:chaperonin cofactor prefoldin